MKRFVLDKLIEWKKQPNRKPLLINGARQVGKTWIMKEFGKQCFEKTLLLDLEQNSRICSLFTEDLDPKRIILGFEVEAGYKIDPQNTLIIIDEIQKEPRAITALKYFYEQMPQYHIIAAGSLLGVALHSGVSYPVGKVNTIEVYPLNFIEFLYAMDEELLAENLLIDNAQIITAFKSKLLNYLKQYMYIGGMPEVVANFAKNKDFNKVREIQKQILEDYENDFSKHIPKDELQKVKMIWASIPAQLAKENKKFIYKELNGSGRAKEYENAISWLEACGLIYRVCRLSKPALPIKSYCETNIFKLFLSDVGLLSAMSHLDKRILIDGDALFTEFKGSITEQFVMQELKSLRDLEIAYWGNDSGVAEVDFVVQCNSLVIPVEVKAGMNLKAKSLKVYMDKFAPHYAVRTSQADYKKTDNLYDIPLYMIEQINTFCSED